MVTNFSLLQSILLIILVMNVWQGSLLWRSSSLVPSLGHQAVHHFKGVVKWTLQDKPGVAYTNYSTNNFEIICEKKLQKHLHTHNHAAHRYYTSS